MSRHRRQQRKRARRGPTRTLADFGVELTFGEPTRVRGQRYVFSAEALGNSMALFAEQLGATAKDVAEAIERDSKALAPPAQFVGVDVINFEIGAEVVFGWEYDATGGRNRLVTNPDDEWLTAEWSFAQWSDNMVTFETEETSEEANK